MHTSQNHCFIINFKMNLDCFVQQPLGLQAMSANTGILVSNVGLLASPAEVSPIYVLFASPAEVSPMTGLTGLTGEVICSHRQRLQARQGGAYLLASIRPSGRQDRCIRVVPVGDTRPWEPATWSKTTKDSSLWSESSVFSLRAGSGDCWDETYVSILIFY